VNLGEKYSIDIQRELAQFAAKIKQYSDIKSNKKNWYFFNGTGWWHFFLSTFHLS
jgi:hypothetical protein